MKKLLIGLFFWLFASTFCFSKSGINQNLDDQKEFKYGFSYQLATQILLSFSVDFYSNPQENYEIHFWPGIKEVFVLGGSYRYYPIRRNSNHILAPFLGVGVSYRNEYKSTKSLMIYLPVGISLAPKERLNLSVDTGPAYHSYLTDNPYLTGFRLQFSFRIGIRF